MNIIKPKSIVLDSSTINDIANDYAKNKKQGLAFETIDFINDNGLIPIILHEHIEEICQGIDSKSAERSLKIISQFKNVYFVKSTNAFQHMIGSIKDITNAEINLAIQTNSISTKEITRCVKESAFILATGSDLLNRFYDSWIMLIEHFRNRVERKKEISSICNIEFGLKRGTRLKDLRKNELCSYSKALNNMGLQKKLINDQIKLKGDPELSNHEKTAGEFHDNIEKDFQLIKEENSPKRIEDIAAIFGITEDEFKECKTIGDVCDLAVFKEQFAILWGGPNIRRDGSRVKPQEIPSWSIIHTVADICRKSKDRASGSDIIDCNLAAMPLYCDYTIVDKRTNQFLQQVSKMDQFKSLVNNFFKLPSYSQLRSKIEQYEIPS
jgi:hypothetical protein